MFNIDVWVAIDEQGDYGVGKDAEEALTNYRETIQDATVALRVVNLELKAAGPKTTVVRGTVPDEVEGEIALTVG